jgi:hypothetical protein
MKKKRVKPRRKKRKRAEPSIAKSVMIALLILLVPIACIAALLAINVAMVHWLGFEGGPPPTPVPYFSRF